MVQGWWMGYNANGSFSYILVPAYNFMIKNWKEWRPFFRNIELIEKGCCL